MATFVAKFAAALIALQLSRVCYVSAAPAHPFQGLDDGATEQSVESSRPKKSADLNDYILQFFYVHDDLKQSNCTETFLGQNVSQHLCHSNAVIFKTIQALNDPINTPENFTYQLCSSLPTSSSVEHIGHDIVLYKRPTLWLDTAAAELEVYITETVHMFGYEWDQLLNHQVVDREATGWQVFHLTQRFSEDQKMCVNLHVFIRVEENTSLLQLQNEIAIQEMFVLEASNPNEVSRHPLIALYVVEPLQLFPDRNFPFPFFGKRSLSETSVEERIPVRKCSIQDHVVNLSEYLGIPVLQPATVNVGACTDKATAQQPEAKADGEELADTSDNDRTISSYCRPVKFDGVLSLVHTEFSDVNIVYLPNVIVTKCV